MLSVIFAAALVSAPPIALATPTASPPTLDGVLDDEVWALATASEGFTQTTPTDGAAPSERTAVRVLYDRDYLYIGIECEQRNSRIVGRLSRRDREVESDRVVVAVDSRGTGTGAFEFGVNASGVLSDSIRWNDTEQSFDWDENWEARTKVAADRWTAEFRIPFRILRFSDGQQQAFGFQVRRFLSAQQEMDEWAYAPRTVAGEVSLYGKLNGISLAQRPHGLELRPFVLTWLRHAEASDVAIDEGFSTRIAPGGDLKWHMTRDLTLEATVNPDFGQVEADQRVLNLTSLETYYPEKRAFFLEGIDVFATPLQLVYTRRIGREVSAPALRQDGAGNPIEVGTQTALPTSIYGALKLTGRLGDAWTVGALQAVTAANQVEVESLVEQPGQTVGARQEREIEPLSFFGALRARRDVGDNASIGLTMTSVVRTAGDDPLSSVDPGQRFCPDGTSIPKGERCAFDAHVGAVDGRWRSASGEYSAFAQVTASVLARGYQRHVPDGTTIHPGDVGLGAIGSVAKDGGRFTGSVWGEYETPELDTNDLGFLARANLASGGFDLSYRVPERLGPTLESRVTLGTYLRYNTFGIPVGSGVGLQYYARLANFWSGTLTARADFAHFDDRELDDGRGTALEVPGGGGYDAVVNSPANERVSFSLGSRGLWFTQGSSLTARASMLVHVVPQWDLELLPSYSFTEGQPRSTHGVDGENRPVFGELRAESVSAVVRSTYTFTPTLTLQSYAQVFLAAEDFSDFSTAEPVGEHARVHLDDLSPTAEPMSNPDAEGGAVNFNVVLRWEYRLGSLFYLTYTRNQVPNATALGMNDHAELDVDALRHAPGEDVISAKLSFLWL
jgi:hypothetical protein